MLRRGTKVWDVVQKCCIKRGRTNRKYMTRQHFCPKHKDLDTLDQSSRMPILSMSYDVGILAGLDRTVQYDFEKVEGALVDVDSLPR